MSLSSRPDLNRQLRNDPRGRSRSQPNQGQTPITIIVSAREDPDLPYDGPLLDLAGMQISQFA
jgi:hypothetical protein